MYELPNSLCPITSFEKYLSKLNPDLDVLWQRPLDAYDENYSSWYCKVPLGRNSLGRMMSDISAQARLSQRYTNHCIRATSLCLADREGIEGRHMVRLSGHKSVASIRSYSRRLSDEKQQQMYDTLGSRAACPNPDLNLPTYTQQGIQTATVPNYNEDIDILEDKFSDENLFVEIGAGGTDTMDLPKQQTTPLVPCNIANEQSTCSTLNQPSNKNVSQLKTASDPHPSFPMDFSINNHMNCFNDQPRPILYNINPTVNNCGQVHFHFHGK